MASVRGFSDQMIDVAERLAAMADAAEGKGTHRGGFSIRWLVLPAAGAGLYALARSGPVTRQAKGVMRDARERAAELPEDLVNRVRQTTAQNSARNGAGTSTRKRSTARRQSQRRGTATRRKTASAKR
jgi:hypothetical protein